MTLGILPFIVVIFSVFFGEVFENHLYFSVCHFKIRKSFKKKTAFFSHHRVLAFLLLFSLIFLFPQVNKQQTFLYSTLKRLYSGHFSCFFFQSSVTIITKKKHFL